MSYLLDEVEDVEDKTMSCRYRPAGYALDRFEHFLRLVGSAQAIGGCGPLESAWEWVDVTRSRFSDGMSKDPDAKHIEVRTGAGVSWRAVRALKSNYTEAHARRDLLACIAGKVASQELHGEFRAKDLDDLEERIRSVRVGSIAVHGGLEARACPLVVESADEPLTLDEVRDVVSGVVVLLRASRLPTKNNVHGSRFNEHVGLFTKDGSRHPLDTTERKFLTDYVPCGELVKHDESGFKICQCRAAVMSKAWTGATFNGRELSKLEGKAAKGDVTVVSFTSILALVTSTALAVVILSAYARFVAVPAGGADKGRAAFEAVAAAITVWSFYLKFMQIVWLEDRAVRHILRCVKPVELVGELVKTETINDVITLLRAEKFSTKLDAEDTCLFGKAGRGRVGLGFKINARMASDTGMLTYRGLVCVPGPLGMEPFSVDPRPGGGYHIGVKRYGVVVSEVMPDDSVIGRKGKLTVFTSSDKRTSRTPRSASSHAVKGRRDWVQPGIATLPLYQKVVDVRKLYIYHSTPLQVATVSHSLEAISIHHRHTTRLLFGCFLPFDSDFLSFPHLCSDFSLYDDSSHTPSQLQSRLHTGYKPHQWRWPLVRSVRNAPAAAEEKQASFALRLRGILYSICWLG